MLKNIGIILLVIVWGILAYTDVMVGLFAGIVLVGGLVGYSFYLISKNGEELEDDSLEDGLEEDANGL